MPQDFRPATGRLYFVAKLQKRLLILDLDAGTVESSSTVSGAFEHQPDQLAFLEGGDLLYFCEDAAPTIEKPSCGVHARDAHGRFVSILDGPAYDTETTGLAFSPDKRHMYVSFYYPGHIFDITRVDGRAFCGGPLDIKWHQPDSSHIGGSAPRQ